MRAAVRLGLGETELRGHDKILILECVANELGFLFRHSLCADRHAVHFYAHGLLADSW